MTLKQGCRRFRDTLIVGLFGPVRLMVSTSRASRIAPTPKRPPAAVGDAVRTEIGAAVTKTTTRVLGGVAVAALAAAGVAAVIRYRQGQTPHPDERAHLDELEARLLEVEEPEGNGPPTRVGRVLQDLHRSQGISVARLRQWIARLQRGALSPEQAAVAESDFDALEREADQRGA
jgi:hypothetical protein